jgi:hypothetical protein
MKIISSMTFKYAIGDAVVRIETLECVLHEMRVLHEIKRIDAMRITERRSVECIGGTQLFYICETWEGNHPIFAEDSLLPMQECRERWVDVLQEVLNAKDEQKAALDKKEQP